MDWICGIQNAINYIENHLTDEIDYEEVQSKAFRQGITFSGFSVYSAATRSGSISGSADYRLRARSLQTKKQK